MLNLYAVGIASHTVHAQGAASLSVSSSLSHLNLSPVITQSLSHSPFSHFPTNQQIAKLAYKNKRFAAVDRAISRNGLKFVTLLRLSPLLPLAASNYIYGLTSVDLGSYVLGSWLGMLPGVCACLSGVCVGVVCPGMLVQSTHLFAAAWNHIYFLPSLTLTGPFAVVFVCCTRPPRAALLSLPQAPMRM